MKYSSYNTVDLIKEAITNSIENDYENYEIYFDNYRDTYKILHKYNDELDQSIIKDLNEITGIDFYIDETYFYLLEPGYWIPPSGVGDCIVKTIKTLIDSDFKMSISCILVSHDIRCELIKSSNNILLKKLSDKFTKKNGKFQYIDLKNI